MTADPGLCELHAHLGGCITLDDVLSMIEGRVIDWSYYEGCFRRAYGRDPGLVEALADLASGAPGARQRLLDLFTFGDEDAGNFDRFYAKYSLISCATLVTSRRLEQGFSREAEGECRALIRRLARRCRASGVRHIEVRAGISGPVALETRRAVYRATLEEMLACSGSDCALAFTPSLPRGDPMPALGVVQELALSELGQALVGVDFAHTEEGFAPGRLSGMALALRGFNEQNPGRALALLYHVGESFSDKSLESAIRWVDHAATRLGAHRLGHAIALGVDPDHHGPGDRGEPVGERRDQIGYDIDHADELRAAGVPVDPDALRGELSALHGAPEGAIVRRPCPPREQLVARQRVAAAHVRQAGAVIEVCPTSNRRVAGLTDPRHHPAHRFVAEGLPFVAATDDPALLATSLPEEERWLRDHAGVDPLGLRRRAWASRSAALVGR